jgi:[cytochrome c]-lysine N-methyltransferase
MAQIVLRDDVTIPGIKSNQEFRSWIENKSIVFHDNLQISTSSLGGIGLVFDGSNYKNDNMDEDLKILTIPAAVTLDYQSLLKLLQELKSRDQLFKEILLRESELIVNLLKLLAPQSETEIIHCYVVAFKILQSYRSDDEYYSQSPLQAIFTYIEVLCSTFTMGFPTVSESKDDFVQKLITMSNTVRLKYESLMIELNEIYKTLDMRELMPFDTYFQIYQAIKSRTLEIPHALGVSSLQVNEEDEVIEEGDDNKSVQDDFHVNVTLVPVLDFANHIHHNNAYFDIDSSTQDIVLKLKHNRIEKSLFEVTINYSPIESIPHFINSYGFIPSITKEPQQYQLLELKLTNLNKIIENGELMCKWLRILPQIQVVYNGTDVFLNFFNNNLPLLFTKDLEYNATWDQIVHGYKIEDPEVNVDTLIQVIELQEDKYDTINYIDPIGIKYKSTPIESLQNTIEAIVNDDDFDYDGLVCDALRAIVEEINHKCTFEVSGTSNFAEVISQYNRLLSKVYDMIIEKYNTDPHLLVLPEELANEQWETEYRSHPNELN